MHKSLLVLIVSGTILAAGCSNEPVQSGPIIHRETIGDLAYEIRLSDNRYGMNEEIEVSTTVTNRGEKVLTYVSGSSSCPSHAVVNIVHQQSATRLTTKSHVACTADLGKSQLKPGQFVQDKKIVIAKYHSQSGLKPAEPGIYYVNAALPPEDIEITEDYQSIAVNPRPGIETQIILSDDE